ncbi:hypothetical protein G5I_13432 [Acromyrmex echinatior]|uniref:Uncharacterized protein n=1 Tax=Acromyrmex echinatior TaxID=103372 RepID=F4X509_ACREC|nr:hypothetical protein G5I_13432 [Acromyrmex echinatior]
MPLRGTSTVLLKLKGGDHVLLHVASTCHSQGDLPRKERWKMSVYFIAKKREGPLARLVLPDKSIGDYFPSPLFCERREKVVPEVRPSVMPSLRLDGIVNDEHKFSRSDEVQKKLTSERSESPRLKERTVDPDCSV